MMESPKPTRRRLLVRLLYDFHYTLPEDSSVVSLKTGDYHLREKVSDNWWAVFRPDDEQTSFYIPASYAEEVKATELDETSVAFRKDLPPKPPIKPKKPIVFQSGPVLNSLPGELPKVEAPKPTLLNQASSHDGPQKVPPALSVDVHSELFSILTNVRPTASADSSPSKPAKMLSSGTGEAKGATIAERMKLLQQSSGQEIRRSMDNLLEASTRNGDGVIPCETFSRGDKTNIVGSTGCIRIAAGKEMTLPSKNQRGAGAEPRVVGDENRRSAEFALEFGRYWTDNHDIFARTDDLETAKSGNFHSSMDSLDPDYVDGEDSVASPSPPNRLPRKPHSVSDFEISI